MWSRILLCAAVVSGCCFCCFCSAVGCDLGDGSGWSKAIGAQAPQHDAAISAAGQHTVMLPVVAAVAVLLPLLLLLALDSLSRAEQAAASTSSKHDPLTLQRVSAVCTEAQSREQLGRV